ncbi:nucleotidyltransferase family protein [Eubacteriales bacterium OttesenSCG-928-A19]|nr:nucleotidyltransferase family protein [Eubacteriales bacterium OttesenSCG-928-A19]
MAREEMSKGDRTGMLEACLLRIARLLNAEGIGWALGASMRLYYAGIVDCPRDLDLLVTRQDAEAADAALRRVGERLPEKETAAYDTERFHEYDVDGVEVDLMAGLVIRHGAGHYAYPFDPALCTPHWLSGERIPLSPLEDWYVLYQLMEGRQARVEAIGVYLRTHGARPDVLRARLKDPLPKNIKASLKALPTR